MSTEIIYKCDRCRDIITPTIQTDPRKSVSETDPLKYTIQYTIKDGESYEHVNRYYSGGRAASTTQYRDKVLTLQICRECSLEVDKCLNINTKKTQVLKSG